MKTYEIGGQKYIQGPVALGQINLLLPLLAGIEIGPDTDAVQLVVSLGGKLPLGLAVVLVEEGANLREAMQPEALRKRAEHLEWALTVDAALEAATDFFEVNRVSSIGVRIGETVSGIQAKLAGTSSTMSSSTHAPETSPSGNTSSGQSPREPSSPGCESEKSADGTTSNWN